VSTEFAHDLHDLTLLVLIAMKVWVCIVSGCIPKAPPSFFGWLGLFFMTLGITTHYLAPTHGLLSILMEPSMNPKMLIYNQMIIFGFLAIIIDCLRHLYFNGIPYKE
jgi:hypothetical protein